MIDKDVDTYLSENFDEPPVLDVWLLVGGENEDLAAEGAHGDEASIVVPGEALDARQDSVRRSCCSFCFCVHLCKGY